MTVLSISSRRTRLASFENCYALAVQLREATVQFIVRTDNPTQPFRVSRLQPAEPETILALVA